jgi:hypothetical protein
MTKDINRGMEALWKYVRGLGKMDAPKRAWVSLTFAEVEKEANLAPDYFAFRAGVEWAEQRLKEKNCGMP